jgi:hypothetical protein
MKGQLNIDQLFAFISRDKDGTEGVIGMMMPNGLMPLIGADVARVDSYMKYAQNMADQMGVPIQVCLFSNRELVREIVPNRLAEKGAVVDLGEGMIGLEKEPE